MGEKEDFPALVSSVQVQRMGKAAHVAFPFSLACDLGTAWGLLVCGGLVYSYIYGNSNTTAST